MAANERGMFLMGLQPIQRDETFDQRVGRTPWSARVPLDPLPQASTKTSTRPTWASAADQGVRPTLHSSIRDKVFSTVRTRQTRVFALRVAHALLDVAEKVSGCALGALLEGYEMVNPALAIAYSGPWSKTFSATSLLCAPHRHSWRCTVVRHFSELPLFMGTSTASGDALP